MEKTKKTIRRLALVGLTALSTAFGGLESKAIEPVKVNGDVTYMISDESKSDSQNSYLELNYSSKLSDSTRVSGAMDFYNSGNGYFGKTAIDRKVSEGVSLRLQGVHGNEPLTQLGAGVSYVFPMPEKTFAVLRYMPLWSDMDGNQIENKQILGYFTSVDLPNELNLSSFGEFNLDSAKGPAWSYGEVELAKKLGNVSIGANLQLNGQGAGKMTPEVVPRIAVRAKF